MKDLGQKSMDSQYGKFVLEKVDEALALSEAYVEKYLPELEVEGEKQIEKQGRVNRLIRIQLYCHKRRKIGIPQNGVISKIRKIWLCAFKTCIDAYLTV